MTNQSTQDPHFTIIFKDDDWAVLELPNGLTTFNIPTSWLPKEAGIGDVLRLVRDTSTKESTIRFIINHEAREVRRKHHEARKARMLRAPEATLPTTTDNS